VNNFSSKSYLRYSLFCYASIPWAKECGFKNQQVRSKCTQNARPPVPVRTEMTRSQRDTILVGFIEVAADPQLKGNEIPKIFSPYVASF